MIQKEQARQALFLDKALKKLNCEAAPSDPRELFQNEHVPFNSLEEIGKFEEKLQDIEAQKLLLKKLRGFGGSMFQDHTRRIMRHFFTDSLAESYTWLGNNGKSKFSSLKLCNIIIDAVEKEHNTSRAQIEEVLKSWLRHAKERKCYVKKSRNAN